MDQETKKKLLRVIEILGALILVGGVTLLVVQRINQSSVFPSVTIQLKPGERLSQEQATMLFEQSVNANLPKYSEGEVQNLLTVKSEQRKLSEAEIQKMLGQ